jgi:hypothetical protein
MNILENKTIRLIQFLYNEVHFTKNEMKYFINKHIEGFFRDVELDNESYYDLIEDDTLG